MSYRTFRLEYNCPGLYNLASIHSSDQTTPMKVRKPTTIEQQTDNKSSSQLLTTIMDLARI